MKPNSGLQKAIRTGSLNTRCSIMDQGIGVLESSMCLCMHSLKGFPKLFRNMFVKQGTAKKMHERASEDEISRQTNTSHSRE